MLKLDSKPIKIGTRICLSEKWHEKLENFSKIQNCPYEYVVDNVVKANKETYYICKSEIKVKNKKVKIALTDFVIRYILSPEVPDSNIGFSFKEYLPIEDTQILITNNKNPNDVVPGILKIEVQLVELNGESFIGFTFKIFYINGNAFTDVKYYSDGSKKSTWKFLFHEDESYMTDYEKMFRDTIVHKSYVIKSAEKLAHYLETQGAVEHAKLLRQRAIIHDDSKLSCIDELHALSRIINDKSSLKDASQQLSPIKKDAIALHWKHNTHHPEHFNSVIDMSKLDIMEMVCDWHARSAQYKTDFLAYVEKRQEDRFHFPEWMYAEIIHYCRVLANDI